MAKILKYLFGDKNKPEWYQEACRNGKIREYKDEDDVQYAVVSELTKNTVIHIGDMIASTGHGLVIIPKEKVSKLFNVSKSKNENNSNQSTEETNAQ